MKRRNFVKNVVLGTSAGVLATGIQAKPRAKTPVEIEGPYYPVAPQNDKDADLTRVKGKTGVAKGEVIEVFGQILDQNGKPVKGATIDLWQANTFGKYRHPHDENDLPLDENFQGWAIIKSDHEGKFKVRTIMPGIYPIPEVPGMIRTPHIHYKVSKGGYESLLTQMYFPDHPVNTQDPLIRKKTAEETALMTAKRINIASTDLTQYEYNMVIEKV